MKATRKDTGASQLHAKNIFMGNSTADKVFTNQKIIKRHQGLPNAGARSADSGARTDNEKGKN